MLIYGLHVKGDIKLIDIFYRNYNISCIQIFTYSPRSYNKLKSNFDAIKSYCNEHKIRIYVHSNYITNSIWSINLSNKNSIESKKKINLILDQLTICDKLNADGLVIHLPKKPITDIDNTLSILKSLLSKYSTPILFENPSVIPVKNLSYEKPQNLNLLCDHINKHNIKWGLCIDTAHLWSSKIFIRDYKSVSEWLKKFTYLDKIKLFHLNGSFYNQNTSKDKHAIPFSKDDKIWYPLKKNIKKSGFYKFIKISKKNGIPILLEINRGTSQEKKTIFNILQSF